MASSRRQRESMDATSEQFLAGLNPELARRIRLMEFYAAQRGISMRITSGCRSAAAQQYLWDHRASNPNPVARPGTSKHEQCLAADIVSSNQNALGEVGEQAGLRWGGRFTTRDPVHFELPSGAGVAGAGVSIDKGRLALVLLVFVLLTRL
jgi:hypothetical protein